MLAMTILCDATERLSAENGLITWSNLNGANFPFRNSFARAECQAMSGSEAHTIALA
jgi:hypothetical protein